LGTNLIARSGIEIPCSKHGSPDGLKSAQPRRGFHEVRQGFIPHRFYAALRPVALGIWAANRELGTTALGLDGHFNIRSQGTGESLPRVDLGWMYNQ